MFSVRLQQMASDSRGRSANVEVHLGRTFWRAELGTCGHGLKTSITVMEGRFPCGWNSPLSRSGGEFWRCSVGDGGGPATLCGCSRRPGRGLLSLCARSFCFSSPPGLSAGLCGVHHPGTFTSGCPPKAAALFPFLSCF